MQIRIVISHILLFLVHSAFGQLEGSIRDANSYMPLQGAVIAGTSDKAISDSAGNFVLKTIPPETVIISHLGYRSDSIVLPEDKVKVIVYLKPDFIPLDQIIVRGPLLSDKLQSIPSSIAHLSQKDITFSDRNSFMESLNQVPGVFVHSGSYNTNRIVIRGIGSRSPYATNRIQAYYNEIPLSSGDGTTVIEDIDPSMINSIQIIKGAKSALYGAGLGGIIQISGHAYFKPGIHGSAAVETGMSGTYKPEFNIQFQKENLSVNTAYSFTSSEGWRQNSRYKRHNLNINAGFNHKKSSTKLLLHLIDVNASIPSSLNYETFVNSPDSAASGWLEVKGFESYQKLFSGIQYTRNMSERVRSITVGFINVYDGYESRPFNILDDQSLQMGYKSHMEFTWKQIRMRLGYQFIFEKYNWSIYGTDSGNQAGLLNRYEETRHPINIFALGGYNFKSGGNIEAGLSYNFLRYDLTDKGNDSLDASGSYRYNPVLSPFIGINLPIGEYIRLYSSLGHGYSPPSVEETLLPEGEINTSLKPESGFNLELGSRLHAFKGGLFIDASLYLLLVKNLLVTERLSEDVFYGANAGSSRHAGFELMSGMRLNRDRIKSLPEIRLNLSLTVSENRFTEFTDDGSDYSNNKLPGIPSSVFWGHLSLNFKKDIYFNYQYQYAGMQYLDDGNTQSYSGYQISSVKLGIRLQPLLRLDSEMYIGTRNLFNAHYASMILVNAPSFGNASPRYYYPGQPRYIYGGIKISF